MKSNTLAFTVGLVTRLLIIAALFYTSARVKKLETKSAAATESVAEPRVVIHYTFTNLTRAEYTTNKNQITTNQVPKGYLLEDLGYTLPNGQWRGLLQYYTPTPR